MNNKLINILYIMLLAMGAMGFSHAAVAECTQPPEAESIKLRVKEDTIRYWRPRIDGDRNTLTCTLVTPPSHGTVTFESPCGSTSPPTSYRPELGFRGTDFFSFVATDACGESTVVPVEVSTLAPCRRAGCYHLDNYPALPAGDLFAFFLFDINDRGKISGHVLPSGNIAIWDTVSQEVMLLDGLADLLYGGATSTSTTSPSLNNTGQLVTAVQIFRPDSLAHPNQAYLYDIDAAFLQTFPLAVYESDVRAINDLGQATGFYKTSLTSPSEAYVWDTLSQSVFGLGTHVDPIHHVGLEAVDINASGQVVGQSLFADDGTKVAGQSTTLCHREAFFWDPISGLQTIGPVPGGDNTCVRATAINSKGQVVGYDSGQGGDLTFIWEPETQEIIPLGTSPYFSLADINDAGQVLYHKQTSFVSEGLVLWEAKRGAVPIFELLDDSGSGWSGFGLAKINNTGQIVALAFSPEGQVIPGVVLTPVPAPVAERLTIEGHLGDTLQWVPNVSDPAGLPLSCAIATPPVKGEATVAPDCSSGEYIAEAGYVGVDHFTYIVNNGQYDSYPAAVEVAVMQPTQDQQCRLDHPLRMISFTGKQGTTKIQFIGHIVRTSNKRINICPATVLEYDASSTVGEVFCKVRSAAAQNSGQVQISDIIKCTDKPYGKDKLKFKIKSGMTRPVK